MRSITPVGMHPTIKSSYQLQTRNTALIIEPHFKGSEKKSSGFKLALLPVLLSSVLGITMPTVKGGVDYPPEPTPPTVSKETNSPKLFPIADENTTTEERDTKSDETVVNVTSEETKAQDAIKNAENNYIFNLLRFHDNALIPFLTKIEKRLHLFKYVPVEDLEKFKNNMELLKEATKPLYGHDISPLSFFIADNNAKPSQEQKEVFLTYLLAINDATDEIKHIYQAEEEANEYYSTEFDERLGFIIKISDSTHDFFGKLLKDSVKQLKEAIGDNTKQFEKQSQWGLKMDMIEQYQ